MSTAALASLSAKIVLTPEKKLEVSYALKNLYPKELCVFNKMYRTAPSGERTMDPNMAYVLIEGETLHLTRSMVEIPAGTKVEFPEVPYVTVLAAGKTVEEKFALAVPVHELHPYKEPVIVKGKEVTLRQVLFSVGVMPKTPNLELKPLPNAGEGVYRVWYQEAAKAQVLLRSDPAKLTVAALVHQS